MAVAAMDIRIIGHNLPGLRCGERDFVHIGVQRGKEVVGIIRGDAATAIFAFTIDAVTDDAGDLDFRGPFVHGKRGERFLYLSWGDVKPDGSFVMFRRAKIHLSALDAQVIAHTRSTSSAIEAVLDLTDDHGAPLCASIRPPRVRWSVSPTAHSA